MASLGRARGMLLREGGRSLEVQPCWGKFNAMEQKDAWEIRRIYVRYRLKESLGVR